MSEDLVDQFIDWQTAAAVTKRLIPAGPAITEADAQQVVDELRVCATTARGHVARVTGLTAPSSADINENSTVLIVDRIRWAQANLDTFRTVLAPVVALVATRRPLPTSALMTSVGSRVTGTEVGVLLSFFATKVLGQFDPMPPTGSRLLLVAPNVVQAERELDVPASDFRLWVCLHEETHRMQFTAVPWLRDHLLDHVTGLMTGLAPDLKVLAAALPQTLQRLVAVLRGEGGSLGEVFASPEQQERLAALTAVMSLLEGHADVVMDEVGPPVIPSVANIRERFTDRRRNRGAPDRLIGRLLGLEAKMRQYREGAAFVRHVVGAVGMPGFNQVWTSPNTLPTPVEIADPALWLRRVHG
ncbi:MAG: zinc-dependent metalloprotease [Actinomycetota bacterium]